jgi:hypothetical protein
MSRLGMGVMINGLFGRDSRGKLIEQSKDKVIIDLAVSKDRFGIKFKDGTSLVLEDDGQSCCEQRYMTCEDKLDEFTGSKFVSVEIRDGNGIAGEHEDGEHEIQFMIIKTDKGDITVTNHNEHNGYYGGFSIRFTTLEEANDDT